jgi:thioredoxin 1
MIYLTDENFDQEISNTQRPILVDFYAEWCPACRVLSPILEKIEKEYEGKLILAKLNVDFAPKTAQKFGINPIPTVILFKGGKPVSGFIGARSEVEIKNWLNENLKENGGTD